MKPKNLINSRKRVQINFPEESLTKQYFKDECDINQIVQRFQETGQITCQNNLEPQFDYAPDIDLKESLDLIHNLQREFEDLEDHEKELFGQNSTNYAQFLSEYAETPHSYNELLKPKVAPPLSKSLDNDEKKALGTSDEVNAPET